MNNQDDAKIIKLKNPDKLSIAEIWKILSTAIRNILPTEIETGDMGPVKLGKDERYEDIQNPVKYSHIVRQNDLTESEEDYTLFSIIYERSGDGAAITDVPTKILFKSANPDVLKIGDDELKTAYYSMVDRTIGHDIESMF